jgi:hypothetical protein
MDMVIKSRADVVAMQQDGETKRKLMDVTSRAHNTETINEAKVNQNIMNAMVSQNKAEIDALTKMLLAKMDTGQLQQEIAMRDAQQQQMAAFSEGEIHTETSPFIQR